jgi:hypothetical protein
MKPRLLPLLFLLLPVAAVAGPRSSANYAISTDTTDSAGGRVTSASYTNDGNAPKIAGHSTTTSPARIVKHGFIGQLTEVLGLDLTAGTTELGEGTTLQLTARIALDDATFTAVSDAGVLWSALNGPITVGGTGLVTGGSVFQSTAATAQAVHSGFTDTIALTVLDTLTDNFGTYASDGIDDDWQMFHFGPNNPLATPTANPDGDAPRQRIRIHRRSRSHRSLLNLPDPLRGGPRAARPEARHLFTASRRTDLHGESDVEPGWRRLCPARQSEHQRRRQRAHRDRPRRERRSEVLPGADLEAIIEGKRPWRDRHATHLSPSLPGEKRQLFRP